MRCFQLAMQGRAHAKEGIPCQDKTTVREEYGTRCIVLADGAGSARLSHLGATAVVETSAMLLCREFNRFYEATTPADVTAVLLATLHEHLHEVAKRQECELSDLASTLLFASCNGDRYIVGQLGDGYLVFSRAGELKLIAKPERGEFANVTYFVTSEHSERHLRLFKGKLDDIDGFFLMSDGAAESLYQRNKDIVAPLVRRLIISTFSKSTEWLENTVSELFNKEILQRTNDDCSIAVMSIYKNYKELFSKMNRQDIFKLFYKKSYLHKQYTEDYINILIQADHTEDIITLCNLTGLNMHTLKRRLQRLQKLGFMEAIKFKKNNNT